MRNFQEKSKWKRFLHSPLSLGFIFLVVLFFAWSVIGFLNKMQETIKNKNIAETKVSDLTAQKAKLTSDIDKLKTTNGVEETIRDKFGLVKEGEDVIVIVDEKPKLDDQKNQENKGFFSFFKKLFK